MRRGESFASVEAEVIDCCGLAEAEKAALWLYGWSFVPRREQRREAMAHIDLLAATDVSARRAVGHLRVAGARRAVAGPPQRRPLRLRERDAIAPDERELS
jgi:hypothetical protein